MRWAAAVRAGLVSAVLTGTLTCCSPAPAHPATAAAAANQSASQSQPQSPSQSLSQPQSQPQSQSSSEVQLEVQRAVDGFNETAGGSVSGQQAALTALLDGGQKSVQRRCAAPTTTLNFEPVYGRLAQAPGWTPTQGTLSGTVYALPTLIRIYTGNRITGTDLTDLHLGVQNGRAWLPALCLS